MLLDEETFFANKEAIVAEVLEKLSKYTDVRCVERVTLLTELVRKGDLPSSRQPCCSASLIASVARCRRSVN